MHLNPGVVYRGNCEYLVGHHADTLGQPVSAAGDGHDVLAVFILIESFAEHEDGSSQIGFFHKSVGPDHLHQVVFGNDFFAAANQDQQQLKCLGSQRNGSAVAQQDLLPGVDVKGAELIQRIFVLVGS